MNRLPGIVLISLATLLLVANGIVRAASISITPASSSVDLADGTATLELYMDFTGEPTIGGGIDLALSGPISFASFNPSAYFTTDTDPFFTGHGTALADADYEIHFGDFDGLGGMNKLGDLTVNLLGDGAASIAIAINSNLGPFFDTNNQQQSVTLNGADLTINPIPLPGAFWLLSGALGLLVSLRRRSKDC